MRFTRFVVLAAVALASSTAAMAIDGIILIDQGRVQTGGITPNDAPGFPVSINQPGSYQLVGNLTNIPVGVNAIEINSDDVTIDLNGFIIRGPFSGTGIGIVGALGGNGLRAGATVINGTVRAMGAGILLGRNSRVERIHASQNLTTGISTDIYSLVQDNIAESNGGTGILATSISTVRGNTAGGNGGDGISVGCPSSVVGNTAANNRSADLNTPHTGALACTRADNVPEK